MNSALPDFLLIYLLSREAWNLLGPCVHTTQALLEALRASNFWGAGGPRLIVRVTPRESQILSWVAAGKSDWAIGRILRISDKTVNFHVENAKRKFGVGTRLQAVVAAMRTGMIG